MAPGEHALHQQYDVPFQSSDMSWAWQNSPSDFYCAHIDHTRTCHWSAITLVCRLSRCEGPLLCHGGELGSEGCPRCAGLAEQAWLDSRMAARISCSRDEWDARCVAEYAVLRNPLPASWIDR